MEERYAQILLVDEDDRCLFLDGNEGDLSEIDDQWCLLWVNYSQNGVSIFKICITKWHNSGNVGEVCTQKSLSPTCFYSSFTKRLT